MLKELPDFDELKELAKTDPEGLESLRKQHVAALINSAPAHYRRRLTGLQFQVDAQRALHPNNPMGSCIAVSQMMYESVDELQQTLESASQDLLAMGPGPSPKTAALVKESAKLYQFPVKKEMAPKEDS